MNAEPVLTMQDPEVLNPHFSLMSIDVRDIVMMVTTTMGMVTAAQFDWVEDDIDDRTFPTGEHGRRKLLIGLVAFRHHVNSDVALQRIGMNSWEPARTEHLLAFARRFKEEQRRYRIVALGATYEAGPDQQEVLVLDGSDHDRGLARHNYDAVWYEGEDLFLVYREI